MGVGSPEDLVEAVGLGVDLFDCVLPTRLGRNGSLFTGTGRVNVKSAHFRADPGPAEPGCDCPLCSRFSMAYLHHLFRNDEILGYRLGAMHNLRHLGRLVEAMRQAIRAADYDRFRADFLARYRAVDEGVRAEQRGRWLQRRAAKDAEGAGSAGGGVIT
jgi:queuine tRNA-ribosyltransferase